MHPGSGFLTSALCCRAHCSLFGPFLRSLEGQGRTLPFEVSFGRGSQASSEVPWVTHQWHHPHVWQPSCPRMPEGQGRRGTGSRPMAVTAPHLASFVGPGMLVAPPPTQPSLSPGQSSGSGNSCAGETEHGAGADPRSRAWPWSQ